MMAACSGTAYPHVFDPPEKCSGIKFFHDKTTFLG